MTALLTADEAARLTLGVNVIVRPGDQTDIRTLDGYPSAIQYTVAPQDWVALTGPCPCGSKPPPFGGDGGCVSEPGEILCINGRRIVPLYRECPRGCDHGLAWDPRVMGNVVDCGCDQGRVLAGRGSIEVVPVVTEDDNRHLDPPFLEVAPSDRCVYWMPDVRTSTAIHTLDPLPVPARDFGIVIDCVELA